MIDVNLNYPERNREVKVVEFENVKKDGVLHNGFEIQMEVDIRDYINDKYKANLVDKNEILIEMPTVSHAWLHDSDEYNKKVVAFKLHCPRTEEAHTVQRNMILSDESRQKKKILLRFPAGIELSNQHYSPDGINGEIEMEMVPFDADVTVGNKTFAMTVASVYWKVSQVEAQPRRVEYSKDKAKKAADKLASKLQGMGI
jgi:hypothetical protein